MEPAPALPVDPDPAAPARPRVWTALLAAVLGIATVALSSGTAMAVTVLLLAAARPGSDPEAISRELLRSPYLLMGLAVVADGALGVLIGVLTLLSAQPWRARLRLRPSGLGPGTILLAAATGIALGEAFEASLGAAGWTASGALENFRTAFAGASPLARGVGVVFMAGFAAPIEELFFRGYVQTRLTERWGPALGILVTALLFGVFHMDLAQGAFAALLGLFLGWLTERTGSIRPAIAVHVCNNALSALTMGLYEADLSRSGYALLLLACAAVSSLGWVALSRRLPRQT